jgi:hypothetical protein
MLEKRDDESGVEVGERQRTRRLTQPLLCEREQQPERVAIGRDRVWARSSLLVQPLGEERFEKAGDQGHDFTRERSSRTVAASSSSGTAVRYHYVDDGPM